jgi:hypothetical protein
MTWHRDISDRMEFNIRWASTRAEACDRSI